MAKCKGIDENGEVCGRPAMYNSDYCRNHRTQDPSVSICMGKLGNGEPCFREAIQGAFLCRAHRTQIADIEKLQCPRGCGQLTYRLADKSGYYVCQECKGTMLDAKSMETRLSKHAGTLNELLASGEVCSLKCPRCEALMLEIRVAYEISEGGGMGGVGNLGSIGHPGALIAVIGIVLIVSVVSAAAKSASKPKENYDESIGETMVIDGWRECGTFWFDASEMRAVKQSTSVEGITAAGIARIEAEIAEKKESRERVNMERARAANTNCLHIDKKTGKKCRRVTFRSTEYCYRHQPE